MSLLHDFPYDEFQQKAIDAVNQNVSVLVAAPTGAGKTVIADHVIEDALAKRMSVVYTSPIKALSNQKYRDFSEKYGDLVGIVTGDVSINANAPIKIMTTEIYRNTLLDQPDNVNETAWVIFDEVHYLDDEERGTVWEESIVLTPLSTKLLCLSATVPNVQEIADWMIEVLDRETCVIIEENRPVPLSFKFQSQGRIYQKFTQMTQEAYKGFVVKNRHFNKKNKYNSSPKPKIINNSVEKLVSSIVKNDELPCIYFVFSRKLTVELANKLRGMRLVTKEESIILEKRFHSLCFKNNLLNETSANNMIDLVKNGVAYHHAGMLPTLKDVIEKLFGEKLIKIIFTTETFALGINMPARSVVFDSLRKFYSSGFSTIRTRDFYQMAGRAGRRGMDDFGTVYARVMPNRIKVNEIKGCIFGDVQPVISQFNASYATLMNLFSRYGKRLYDIYPSTLSFYQSNKRNRKLARQRLRNKMTMLEKIGAIRDEKLTAKGEFAGWMFGYELFMAEMFESGMLDRMDSKELCFALSCLVYEPKKNDWSSKRPPKKFGWIIKKLNNIYHDLSRLEYKYDIDPPIKRPQPDLANGLDAWMKGADFQEVVEISEIDEGSLVRYFRMIIQLLRQISQAPRGSEMLRQNARNARKLIDRDIIDAEKQLRG